MVTAADDKSCWSAPTRNTAASAIVSLGTYVTERLPSALATACVKYSKLDVFNISSTDLSLTM